MFLKCEESLDIICLNEHWLTENEFSNIIIENYVIASTFCRSKYGHGGVAILVHESLKNWKPFDLHSYCEEKIFEVAGIIISNILIIT